MNCKIVKITFNDFPKVALKRNFYLKVGEMDFMFNADTCKFFNNMYMFEDVNIELDEKFEQDLSVDIEMLSTSINNNTNVPIIIFRHSFPEQENLELDGIIQLEDFHPRRCKIKIIS